jgi:low temperature requirement protein LtrA
VASVAQAGRGRERSEVAGRVGFIELFFDLVFVFAITQVSHLLLEHLSWSGAAETAFVLVAVWWTWITVLWWTDWLGTESAVGRLELVAAIAQQRRDHGRDERRAQRLFAEAENRHHLVRDAFTYLHLPIVAGLVVVAVANELVIAHPDEELAGRELLALAAGPILFLLGSAAAVLRVLRTLPRRRVAAAAAVAGVALLGAALPALATWSLALAVLALVVLVEARES